jgi:hypothetical protein
VAELSDYEDVRDWLGGLIPAATTFVLRRAVDVSGISGTGVVADGVRFPDGKTVTRWRGGTTGVAQTCVWDSIQHVRRIHGHDGATRIETLPYGTLVKMIVAALEAAGEEGDVVKAVARELADHREYEDALNRAARGDKSTVEQSNDR